VKKSISSGLFGVRRGTRDHGGTRTDVWFGDKPDRSQNIAKAGYCPGNDIIVDFTLQQPFIAVANAYANHPITQKMQGMAALFPTARSVLASEGITGTTTTELVLTSDQAWARPISTAWKVVGS